MRVPAAARSLTAFAVLVGSLACGAQSPTEPTPAPAPVYDLKTSTFTGTVKTGGTVAFPFTVVNPGDINVSITELGPVSTITMGIALGFWDATASTCTQQLSTSAATLNLVFAASPSSPGEYCVGIFDTGNVQAASDFTMKVTYY
jgi:hypothetical protein